MAIYERRIGGHVGQRVQPEPGSDLEKELDALVEAAQDNWVRLDGQPAEPEDDGPPSRSASKGAWVAYAIRHGLSDDDAKATTRDELAGRFLGPAEPDKE